MRGFYKLQKILNTFFSLTLVTASAFTTSAVVFSPEASASTECKKTYSSGSTLSKFEWCFSEDGNIVRLEHPEGLEHIYNGTITEGYCVSADGTVRGISYGSDANVSLEDPKASGTRVRHETLDGSLRIEQKFKQTKSRNNKEINIEVTMKVKNLTNGPLFNVYVTRFVDADMSNTTGSDMWAAADRSVSVTQPGSARLDLIPITKTFLAESLIYPSFLPVLDGNCYDSISDSSNDDLGDRSMGVRYDIGTIERKRTKTFKFVYRINS